VASIEELTQRLCEDGRPKTEFLVVDEGQDLLEERVFKVIERTVTGGLEGGQWWWFMDCNNQSGLYGAADCALADYLRECAAAPPFHLDRNCRNTKEIVEFLRDALAADLGAPKPEGSGIAPRITELPEGCRRIDLIRRVHEAVAEHLDDETLDPGQLTIVVVGKLSWAEELLSELDRRLRRRIRRFALADVESWPPRQKTLYTSAEEIKGLENDRLLVLTDPDISCSIGSLTPHLYVALTRARISLHWIVPASVRAALKEFVEAREHAP
jgi:DNA helicase IV